MFRVYAINVYKNDLPFKRTLARDDPRGLLIASFNENSVVFSDSGVFDKVSDNNRTTANMHSGHSDRCPL